MKNLADISIWRRSFGLLPIHLKPNHSRTDFVMLNGGYGDFCLQTVKDESDLKDYYSKSWSSNTSNFIVLENDKIKIINWARDFQEEVAQKTVAENFDKFYSYLLSKSYKSNKNVVPFIINIFRQFRNITQERANPIEALNLLFILLASLEDDYKNIDFNKWNINQTVIPGGFDYFVEKIHSGINKIKPEIEIIIRHSAGILFQEAQKEVLFFNPQRDLFGGISNQLETSNKLHSSIHYTPPYIARTIVENGLRQLHLDNKESIKIFDPACGSSEFLVEALKQLKELGFEGEIELIGWDSSETAVNTSKFLLKYEQRTIWEDKLRFEVRLVNDSLTEDWDNDYDLILMNPPFISWELLNTKDSRDAVRNTLGTVLSGKPNQASAFFYKSLFHLSTTGVLGCVVPSSLLTLDAYKKLRNSAFQQVGLNLIGKLGNFIFEDALTDVSLIIAYKPKTNSIPTVLWTRNEKGVAQNALRDLRKMYYSSDFSVNEKNYSIFQPLTFPIIEESWKTISLKENELIKIIERFVFEKKLVRVKDIFSVKQGINSGNNNVFKLTKEEFSEFGTEEKKYFRPVIDNSAIKSGVLKYSNFVWYPYDENGIQIKSEHEFRQCSPIYFKKIYPFKEQLANRPRKSEANWWYLSEHRHWLLKKEPRLVSTRFGNSDSFAFDANGEFIVENGNAWLPKKDFMEPYYYFYLALFSSALFNELLSIYSKQLSGGEWYDLGRKYSQEIPIPNIHNKEVRNSEGYYRLIEIGKEISDGNKYVKNISDELLKKYFYPEA